MEACLSCSFFFKKKTKMAINNYMLETKMFGFKPNIAVDRLET